MDDAIIALALTQIVNLSISKAEFSSPFKLARVVPIHKQAQKVIIPTKQASRSLSWSSCGMVVLIWISEVVFSQGFVKSCLLSGRVGIVSTAV